MPLVNPKDFRYSGTITRLKEVTPWLQYLQNIYLDLPIL